MQRCLNKQKNKQSIRIRGLETSHVTLASNIFILHSMVKSIFSGIKKLLRLLVMNQQSNDSLFKLQKHMLPLYLLCQRLLQFLALNIENARNVFILFILPCLLLN